MVSKAEDLWAKARPYLGVASAGANASARHLLKRAVELEPDFARGWGHLSYCSVRDAVYGWVEDRSAAIKTAVALAEKASRKPDEYDNIWSLAIARFHDGQHDEAIRLYDDALDMAKDDFVLVAESTDVLVCAGRANDALNRIDLAISKLPKPQPDWILWNRAFALMGLKQYDEAIDAYRALPALNAASAAELAAILATTKPADEAKVQIEAIADGLSEEDNAAFLRTMPMLRFTAAAADLQAIYEGGMSKAQALIER